MRLHLGNLFGPPLENRVHLRVGRRALFFPRCAAL